MMGLRLAEGVAIVRVESTSGRPLRASVDAKGLDQLVDGGLLRMADEANLGDPGRAPASSTPCCAGCCRLEQPNPVATWTWRRENFLAAW